jgi:hypothetical protein
MFLLASVGIFVAERMKKVNTKKSLFKKQFYYLISGWYYIGAIRLHVTIQKQYTVHRTIA